MEQEFRQLIDAVAARLRRPDLWRMTAIGLFAGGLLGLLLAVVARVGDWPTLRWIVLGCVVLVPLAAIAVGAMQKVDPLRAIRAIDAHYHLKSRTLTLWSFLQTGHLNEARQLAVDEAWKQVKQADPAKVVPLRVPKSLFGGAALVVLAVALAFVPLPGFTTVVEPPDDTSPLSVAGEAELTALAPLPAIAARLAAQSLKETRQVVSEHTTPQTPLLPTGSEAVVSRYFETDPAPETEP